RLQDRRHFELLRLLQVDTTARRQHVAYDLLAPLHLPTDLFRLAVPVSFELRRQLAGEDLDRAERRVQLVRGAGGQRPQRRQSFGGLRIRARPVELLSAPAQRFAHPQRERGDERRGNYEGDPAAAQVQERRFGLEGDLVRGNDLQGAEGDHAGEGEADAPAR